MTDVTLEMIVSFCIWPYLVVFLVYLHDWLRWKLKKKGVTEK